MTKLAFSPETIKKALESGLIGLSDIESLALCEKEMMAKNEARFSVEMSWLVEDLFEVLDKDNLFFLLRQSSGHEALFEVDYHPVAKVQSGALSKKGPFIQVTAEGFIWVKTFHLTGRDLSSRDTEHLLLARGDNYVFQKAFSLGLFENLRFSVEKLDSQKTLQTLSHG